MSHGGKTVSERHCVGRGHWQNLALACNGEACPPLQSIGVFPGEALLKT